jgi:NAD(P)-dependent dehydrogenase (short-subunit alcohol dehydrogenase family)
VLRARRHTAHLVGVAVSSPMAAAPATGTRANAVGKAAQETLFAAVAREMAGTGVTANVVWVRAIDTHGVRVTGALGKGDTTTGPSGVSAAVRYRFSDDVPSSTATAPAWTRGAVAEAPAPPEGLQRGSPGPSYPPSDASRPARQRPVARSS